MDNNPQPNPMPQITPEPINQPTPFQPAPETPPTSSFEPQKPAKKSKKKLIILLIIIALLLIGGGVLVAVMLQPKSTTKLDKSSPSKSSVSTATPNTDVSEIPVTYDYRTPEANAKFTIPINRFNPVNRGYCHVLSYYEDTGRRFEVKYIIAIHNNSEAADVNNEDINDFLLKRLVGSLDMDMDDLIKINSDSSLSSTINGFNALKFEGNAILADVYDKEYSVYSVGYTFSVEGFPMQVIGFVVDKTQSQTYKDMVAEDVDKIMGTIRLAE